MHVMRRNEVGKSILRANGGAAIAVFGLSCALGVEGDSGRSTEEIH